MPQGLRAYADQQPLGRLEMLLNDGVRSLSRHGVFSPRETEHARHAKRCLDRQVSLTLRHANDLAQLHRHRARQFPRRSIQAMINDALIASSSARTPSRDWASPERRPG